MARTLEVIEIGDEVGVVIPDEILSRWQQREGDRIYLTETDGGFILTPDDPNTR